MAQQDLTACTQIQAPPGGSAGLRWQRIELHSEATLTRWLDARVPDAIHLELWRASTGQAPHRERVLGAHSLYADRPLPGPRLLLPLELTPGPHTLWLGYRLHGDGVLTPQLLSPERERALRSQSDLLNGALAGGLLALGLGVLCVRLFGGSSAYLAYALLLVCELMLVTQTEGYAFAWLWPESPGWNQIAPQVFALATLAAHVLLALRFLQLRQRHPLLWRAHMGLSALIGVALMGLGQPWSEPLTLVLGLSYAPLALGSAVLAWRDRLPGAPLYALGVFALALGGIVPFALGVVGLNPLPFDHFVYPRIGLFLEASFFSAALINRMRQQQADLADQRLRRLAEAEDLLQAESQRRAALDLAQQQGLRLAGASHDISQPLSSLRFAIAALQRSATEAQSPITQHLDHTLSYAQTLLSDLIQQTRTELPLRSDHLELGPWLRTLAQAHQAQAQAKGLTLRVAPCSAEIEASQLILARILNNLISNALRYTQRGGVLVGVRRRPGGLEIQVLDSGPGLLPAQIERLQRPFERGSNEHPGHGLGLFIVKSLCAQNGYRFTVRSRLGRGSLFAVTVDTVSE